MPKTNRKANLPPIGIGSKRRSGGGFAARPAQERPTEAEWHAHRGPTPSRAASSALTPFGKGLNESDVHCVDVLHNNV